MYGNIHNSESYKNCLMGIFMGKNTFLMNYIDIGQGETLVFVHGFSSNKES